MCCYFQRVQLKMYQVFIPCDPSPVSSVSFLHTADLETIHGIKDLKSQASSGPASAPKSLLGTGRTLPTHTNEQEGSMGAGTSPTSSDKMDSAIKGEKDELLMMKLNIFPGQSRMEACAGL